MRNLGQRKSQSPALSVESKSQLRSLMGPTTAAAAGGSFVGMPKRRSMFMNSMKSSFSIGMVPSRSRIAAVMTASQESIYPSIMSNPSPLIRSGSKAAVVFDYKRMMEEEGEMKKNMSNESDNAEKLDEWIQESIGEIVRNIGEAPFLVQIFSQGTSSLKLEKEKASPESWPLVRKKWDLSNCKPDGVILVEELKDEEQEDDDASNSDNGNDSSNKTWGLVVQGRCTDWAASCYILSTCRVKSAGGFSTHFCLVRAKCFGETLDKQIRKAWLQGR